MVEGSNVVSIQTPSCWRKVRLPTTRMALPSPLSSPADGEAAISLSARLRVTWD
jgi:hypothetical protein